MTRLINSSKNLFHYAMLLTTYSCGLRRSELCRLKVIPDRAEARAVAALVENVYRTLNAASGNGLLWRQPPIRIEIGRQASSQDGPVLRIMRWDWENRFVMWVTYGFCSGPEAP